MTHSVTDSETERLDAFKRWDLLDTLPSGSFDRIFRTASLINDLPIAAVSLTDSDKQWFTSRYGVERWSLARRRPARRWQKALPRLKAAGSEKAQGYLFALSMSVRDLETCFDARTGLPDDRVAETSTASHTSGARATAA